MARDASYDWLADLNRSDLEFITMGLDNGIVLPGITRESLIELLDDHASGKSSFPLPGLPTKLRVVERDISMSEIVTSIEDGSLKGMFGCGTGVVVVQIGEIQYQEKIHKIPHNPLIQILRDAVTGIQRGKIEHPWSHKVPEWDGSGAEKDREEDNVLA